MLAINGKDAGTPAAQGESVTLSIDGALVTVPAGTSIMRAAAAAGGAIPKLCATDTLKAFGSCRVCLVEVEGQRGFPASCTTLVAPGMKVQTESEKLRQLRIEHRDLDEVISRLSLDLNVDELQVKRLKKRKLALKDQMDRLESELIPDLNA